MNQIKIATIGDSDPLKVGEQVVAIGNALGYGQSISSAEELTEKLNYYAVGETVPITYEYLKDDAYVEKTVDVTLMENPNANNK